MSKCEGCKRAAALLESVEADDRLGKYAPATTDINAPLALIQVELAATATTCRRILGLGLKRYPHRKRAK